MFLSLRWRVLRDFRQDVLRQHVLETRAYCSLLLGSDIARGGGGGGGGNLVRNVYLLTTPFFCVVFSAVWLLT